MVERELRGYALADRIIAPSTHVVDSFTPWPECARKVFLNPLGVDIDQFPMRVRPSRSREPTVLFVGQWSYRKGVDVLTEAIMEMDRVTLVHVGALSDVSFPKAPQFIHRDPVPQQKLAEFYSAADVFVLPSREDGFGVVLSQALSSGVSVVCTDATGGPDLAQLPGLSRLIRIVPSGDPTALRCALNEAIDDSINGKVPPITEAERRILSWRTCALRELRLMEAAVRAKHARQSRLCR
jgi:glycosyltransferase involved in cell wall biosynthesis